MNKQIAIKCLWLIFLFLSSISAVNASSFVLGRIYMKSGAVIECAETDRIRLPKRSGDAVFLRNAYRKNEVKERFKADQIDSIIAWNPATPDTSASLFRQKALDGCGFILKRPKSA